MKASRIIGALLLLSGLVACVPPPPDGGPGVLSDPESPFIDSFRTIGPVGNAPALATFAWTIGDVNGDTLTCYIDGDGDGVDDIVINDCDSNDTRNFALDNSGPVTARLTVTDGNSVPATMTLPITVTPGLVEPYNIEMRGLDTLDPEVRDAFTSAAARWEDALPVGIADTPAIPLACAAKPDLPLPTNIDDLFIDVEVVPIDGVGGTLGQAGPTCVAGGTTLSVVGLMSFDSADVDQMVTDGTIHSVIEHEMGHVLGIGTLWGNLILNAGTSNTQYTGPKGVAEWRLLGGNGNIPLESTGGVGTNDSHWSEAVFDSELMTGYIEYGPMPMSRMTIASLGDLGLHVNLAAADAYSLPSGTWMQRPAVVTPRVEGVMLRPEVSFTTGTP